ncbi:hypothetical protein ACQ4LE_007600 [Meloidogyne hapla]
MFKLLLLIMTVLIISKAVNTLSVYEQSLIVDCHNIYRSQVAYGKAKNSTGFLPKGKNIKEIIYCKDLEEIAEKWNCSGGNNEDYGENAYGFEELPVPNALPFHRNLIGQYVSLSSAVLLKACNTWAESCKYGVAEDLEYDSAHSRSGACTQMIWAETFKIGCAFIKCPIYNYLVCRYSPRGNNPGELIYQKGSVCTECGDKGCSYTYGLCL